MAVKYKFYVKSLFSVELPYCYLSAVLTIKLYKNEL